MSCAHTGNSPDVAESAEDALNGYRIRKQIIRWIWHWWMLVLPRTGGSSWFNDPSEVSGHPCLMISVVLPGNM
jgi:hypothetical protein